MKKPEPFFEEMAFLVFSAEHASVLHRISGSMLPARTPDRRGNQTEYDDLILCIDSIL
jgi:hypothetical protein